MIDRLIIIKTQDNPKVCVECGHKTQPWTEGGVICTNCCTLHDHSEVWEPKTGCKIFDCADHAFAVDWAFGFTSMMNYNFSGNLCYLANTRRRLPAYIMGFDFANNLFRTYIKEGGILPEWNRDVLVN